MDHTDDCSCTPCLQRRCIVAQIVEIARRDEERNRYRYALMRIACRTVSDPPEWEIAREALGGGSE